MKKLYFILAALLSVQFIHAQEAQETKESEAYVHRYVGLGIRTSPFQISELPINVVPPNRLLVNVDPIKYARIELHYGKYNNEREINYTSFSGSPMIMKLKERSVVSGLGLFGVYPREKVKFIAGMRYSLNNYKQDDIEYDPIGNPYTTTNKGKITILSAVLGGEYYLSKWFSVGAEFSLISMSDTFDPVTIGQPDLTTKTSITESSLVFRFYPY